MAGICLSGFLRVLTDILSSTQIHLSASYPTCQRASFNYFSTPSDNMANSSKSYTSMDISNGIGAERCWIKSSRVLLLASFFILVSTDHGRRWRVRMWGLWEMSHLAWSSFNVKNWKKDLLKDLLGYLSLNGLLFIHWIMCWKSLVGSLRFVGGALFDQFLTCQESLLLP